MIIGITGTNGAGKGTVVEYLVEKGFTHYSMSGVIIEEIKRRGMPMNRDNTRLVGNDLRKTHGPAYLVETNYERATQAGGDAIIEALRAIGEAEFLKEHAVSLLAVDADRRIRYERITGRAGALDQVTFEHFSEQEDRELTGTDIWDMNIAGVMAMADYTLTNDGTLEALHAQVDEILKKITK
ncbi:MAG TPA: AAA family ATPase [Candidatus Paceibacterota bacterium]